MDRHFYCLAPDPTRPIQAFPAHLTPAQAQARATFDLDEVVASLPPRTNAEPSPEGAAGVRLREGFACSWPDDMLREFARDVLGAQRISAKYLEALRIVLGNQAKAERWGYVLEMNVRVPFAPVGVMRTIIGQMTKASISQGVDVYMGGTKTQTVQCYQPPARELHHKKTKGLETYLREQEAMTDGPLSTKVWPDATNSVQPDEVPY